MLGFRVQSPRGLFKPSCKAYSLEIRDFFKGSGKPFEGAIVRKDASRIANRARPTQCRQMCKVAPPSPN